jgi:predicted transcriptional regulator
MSDSIRDRIEARIDELEALMRLGKFGDAEVLLPSITKFMSILTEDQRDLLGAARLAIAKNLDWTE